MNNNIINVNKVSILGNRIEYNLDIKGEINKYFNTNKMFVEYNKTISSIPEGIAIIPLLTNILPIVWLTNSKIIVNEIDKTFYECINSIKKGYSEKYKKVNFIGEMNTLNIIDYSYKSENKCATFFSGGIDSLATLITRIDEKPDLITVWGADIKTHNEKAWNMVRNEVLKFGKNRCLNNILIKSNFREFINEQQLDKSFYRKINSGWWHGIQHGIGLIGLVAPYAYLSKMNIVYIPSTVTKEDGNVPCASYPTIDNKVKFASCKVFHEGFENTRQKKVEIIAKYIKTKDKSLPIRVCWRAEDGKNCGICEKCSKTIMALIAEGINPNEYGLLVTKESIKNMYINIKNHWVMADYVVKQWEDIQYRIIQNNKVDYINELSWILDINFKKLNKIKRVKSIPVKINKKLIKLLKK